MQNQERELSRREPQHRNAEVSGVDASARTVELSFSSEAEVLRPFGIEILSHSRGACDLSRLNSGGAVLVDHDRARQVGVVEKAWIGADFIGRARVRFSRSAAGEEVLQDIIDGVRRHVSVGYNIVDFRRTGQRDGEDVILVTKWAPHEISIVSVPADTDVGIGRSAEKSTAPIAGKREKEMPQKSQNLVEAVRSLLESARTAETMRPHIPVGCDTPTRWDQVPAGRSLTAVLSGSNLAELFDSQGRLRRTPNAAPSSGEITMDAAVIANSRAARAGAGVLVLQDRPEPIAIGSTGDIAFQHVPGFVRNVDPAVWQTVDVATLAEVTPNSNPITSVQIDWNNATAKAACFEFTRARRLTYGDQTQLIEQIVAALTMGLSRAADEVLFSALAGLSLETFSVAKAAELGVSFGELRAIIGTDADAATVGTDGALRANGIAGDLTADMPGTIIGAWDRSVIAIRDDIKIHIERTGLAGEMKIVAWAAMLPVVPVPQYFFAAA